VEIAMTTAQARVTGGVFVAFGVRSALERR